MLLLHRVLRHACAMTAHPILPGDVFSRGELRRRFVTNKMLATLTDDPRSWRGASLLSVTQITADGLTLLFRVSQHMRTLVQTKGGDSRLQHTVLGTVFYEASTRTCCSFQAAMMRLGGTTIHVDGQGNTSAGKKGETLEDTIRCLECYADVTVLRHPVQGSVGRIIANVTKPVINAGDGVGEHPTQALLDVFTIYDELLLAQRKMSLVVVLLGDLKHGRTVHSLAKLLVNASIWEHQLTLRYCAPDGLEMPYYVQDFCSNFANVHQESYTDLSEACEGANVLYVTRIQRERFETDAAFENVQGSYVVDRALMKQAAPSSNFILLHPLPRVDEISRDVDRDERASYFRQMENGMYVRMALLSLLLGKG